MQDVGYGRPQEAKRINAVMLIEPPVLDRNERLRQVGWHLLERDRRAVAFPTDRQWLLIEPENLDRWRTLGDIKRLQRRQMHADPDQRADGRDHEPEREDEAPIKRTPPGKARAAAAFALGGFPLFSLGFAALGRPFGV